MSKQKQKKKVSIVSQIIFYFLVFVSIFIIEKIIKISKINISDFDYQIMLFVIGFIAVLFVIWGVAVHLILNRKEKLITKKMFNSSITVIVFDCIMVALSLILKSYGVLVWSLILFSIHSNMYYFTYLQKH